MKSVKNQKNMNMKNVKKKDKARLFSSAHIRNVLILFGMIFALGVVKIIYQGTLSDDAYRPGVVIENHYESEWLGLSFDTPEGFEMASKSEVEKLQKESAARYRQQMQGSRSNVEMMAKSENGTSITVMLWDMGGNKMTAKQYSEGSRDTLLQNYGKDLEFSEEGEVTSVQLAGQEYEHLKMQFGEEKDEVCSESYTRVIGDYAVIIGILYTPENTVERDAVVSALQQNS